MTRRRTGDKPLHEPMMTLFLTHICGTRGRWVKKCTSLRLFNLYNTFVVVIWEMMVIQEVNCCSWNQNTTNVKIYYLTFDQKVVNVVTYSTWWRHKMDVICALLTLCAGNSPIAGEFPAQRPVTRIFDVFFDLPLNKLLRKQSPSRSLCRQISNTIWKNIEIHSWHGKFWGQLCYWINNNFPIILDILANSANNIMHCMRTSMP